MQLKNVTAGILSAALLFVGVDLMGAAQFNKLSKRQKAGVGIAAAGAGILGGGYYLFNKSAWGKTRAARLKTEADAKVAAVEKAKKDAADKKEAQKLNDFAAFAVKAGLATVAQVESARRAAVNEAAEATGKIAGELRGVSALVNDTFSKGQADTRFGLKSVVDAHTVRLTNVEGLVRLAAKAKEVDVLAHAMQVGLTLANVTDEQIKTEMNRIAAEAAAKKEADAKAAAAPKAEAPKAAAA